MLAKASSWISLMALVLPFAPGPVGATDVDGGNDCPRPTNDFGDAPENFDAYPGVLGHFPTCTGVSAAGTQEISCAPISTPPGPTGYVLHRNTDPGTGYWFGCAPAGTPPAGIDSETDGKTSFAAGVSFCANIPVDCMEASSYGTFGQDECFGGSDAGLAAIPDLLTCTPTTIKFETTNCLDDRDVYLNVLLDMNSDGDWNDNFECAEGCAYEWALKNVVITLPPGCSTQESMPFLVGPNEGPAWMRITISDGPVSDDFPWDGSEHFQEGFFFRGETEDYPLEIAGDGGGDPCQVGYQDFGDAPEGIVAYPSGVVGEFPTCTTATGIGTQEVDAGCAPVSTPPGPTGFVRHVQLAAASNGLWFGCAAAGPVWVDSEPDGKVNNTPPAGTPSSCNGVTPTDCLETAMGLAFGQDECVGDGVDAGLTSAANPVFDTCSTTQIRLRTFNCSNQPVTAFINLLFDWNEDGDWNDVLACETGACTPEWAVQNLSVVIPPGCSIWTSPVFQVGSKPGFGWMRATISFQAVPMDFPWNGSVSMPSSAFQGGETEDYPIEIRSPSTDVGVIENGDGLWLSRGTPNPATSSTEVRFALTRTGPVRVIVYDVGGRRVRTLVNGSRGPGSHVATWDLRNERGESVAPGIYMVRLEAEGRALTSRVTRVR